MGGEGFSNVTKSVLIVLTAMLGVAAPVLLLEAEITLLKVGFVVFDTLFLLLMVNR